VKWLFNWWRRRSDRPGKKELSGAAQSRAELEKRREKLLYEALEIDHEIQGLYRRYKESDNALLKQELTRTLTIKRAEYESLQSRLTRLGDAELSAARRSAFLQSFLDLPSITERDLDRLENLQSLRRDEERRAVLFTDRVIGLTDTVAERSERAEELERETIGLLEAQTKPAAKEAAKDPEKESEKRVEQAPPARTDRPMRRTDAEGEMVDA